MATALIGHLGDLREIRCPTPELDAPIERTSTARMNLAGMRLVQRAPRSARKWTISIPWANQADIAALVELESLPSTQPTYYYEPAAAALNMLRPSVAAPGLWGDEPYEASGGTLTYSVSGSTFLVDVSANVNLLTANQASIETDTTGWAVSSACTIARTTAQAAHGAASLEITSTTVGNDNVRTDVQTPVEPGRTYTAVAEFRAATDPRTCFVQIRYLDVPGGVAVDLFQSIGVPDTTTGWTQVSVTGVCPVGATVAEIRLIVETSATSEVHYADKMGLREGSSTTWVMPTTAEAIAPTVPVVAGRMYTASAFASASSRVRLHWVDADEMILSTTDGASGTDRRSVTGVAPLGAAGVRVALDPGTAGNFNRVQLTETATVVDWFPGEGIPRVSLSGLQRTHQAVWADGTIRSDYTAELLEVG